MSEAVTAAADQRVARPLRVLVPLIQKDLAAAKRAADEAGLPYFQAAGEKLLEAKEQVPHGAFVAWIKEYFALSVRTAQQYMQVADAQKRSGLRFSTVTEAIRGTSNPNYNRPTAVRPTPWFDPVKQIVNQVDTDTLNRHRAELKRQEERDAQRKLALQLIDIGYKVLARTLHPDKGGSRDAMVRLNLVRKRLKDSLL